MQLYCTLASTYRPAGHELSKSIEQRPSEPGLVLLLLFYRVRGCDGHGAMNSREYLGDNWHYYAKYEEPHMNSSDLPYNKSLRSTCSSMRSTTAAPPRTTPYAPYMYPVY